MPVRNSNHIISALPDFATHFHVHLIVYWIKKGHFHFNHILEDGLSEKVFCYY